MDFFLALRPEEEFHIFLDRFFLVVLSLSLSLSSVSLLLLLVVVFFLFREAAVVADWFDFFDPPPIQHASVNHTIGIKYRHLLVLYLLLASLLGTGLFSSKLE